MNPCNNFDNVLIRRQQDIWEGHPHWDHPLLNHYHSTFLAYLYNSCHAELSAPDVPSFTLFCHKELASLQILKSCFSSQNLQMIFLFVILFLVKVLSTEMIWTKALNCSFIFNLKQWQIHFWNPNWIVLKTFSYLLTN